jgi:hypothetical protein
VYFVRVRPVPRTTRTVDALIVVALVIGVAVIFAPVRSYALVDFDDLVYVTDNAHVASGLSIANVVWAFTHAHEGYWTPLTWISYMADVEIAGLSPGQLHLSNVRLHALSSGVLFLVLLMMTRARWPSAFVAAVFALHPLHVESVAWVAERKDVLSGVFWWLALGAWVWWVRQPSWSRYAAVVMAFTAGLLAKPIVVTLPVVLLLMDLWPLGRVPPGRWPSRRLVLEKVPLIGIAVGVGVVTIVVQDAAGAVASLDDVPLALRVQTATISYASYLWRMVWPAGLAPLYPYPFVVPIWQVAVAAVLLLATSLAVWRQRVSRPYLIAGWLWYLVTIAPVSGLMQAGPQARADRYTYLSMVGIAIMAAWGARDLARGLWSRRVVAAAGGAAVIACALVARQQVQHWQDSETLFRRAIAVTRDNYVAYTGLGTALRSGGDARLDEAIRAFDSAVRIQSRHPEAQGGLGEALLASGRADLAVPHLEKAVRLRPRVAEFHLNLGSALNLTGRHVEAAAGLCRDCGAANWRLPACLARRLASARFDGCRPF